MANRADPPKMEKDLYVAAMTGVVEFLRNNNNYYYNYYNNNNNNHRTNEYYLRKTSEQNNIIHIAVRHSQLKFIKKTLKKFPNNYSELISEGNSKKNTPLHIAAEVGNFEIVSLLYEYLKKSVEEADRIATIVHQEEKKPWREPNSKGYTAVHVAIIHGNVKIAKFLLNEDPELALIVVDDDKSKEAPLHLAIKQHVNFFESETIMAKIQQPINQGGAGLAIDNPQEENMSSLIEFLVEKESCVASWPDGNGLTPLHKAASLSTPYNIEIIHLIIEKWPQAAEVCDASGMSILHHLINKNIPSMEGKKLLDLKEIYALRNHQDEQGNTPLHLAVKNKDVTMARILLTSSTKLNINNRDGLCATSVIQQQKMFQMLRQREMTKEETEAADGANILYLRERLGKDFLLSTDAKGKNVLHKLMHMKNKTQINRGQFLHFIQDVLETFPMIIGQTDQLGNTPVHILMQNQDANIIFISEPNYDHIQKSIEGRSLWYSGLLTELLEIYNKCILSHAAEVAQDVLPWVVQNAEGNTPLHEAVKANHKTLAMKLLEYDQKPASLVNKRKETPLHLLAGHPTGNRLHIFNGEEIDKLVKANADASQWTDEENLTPILRAFKVGNLDTATMLCRVCPVKALEIEDYNGETFWHLLIRKSKGHYLVYNLLLNKALRDLLTIPDNLGNTPLHLAITENRFDILEAVFEIWEKEGKSSSPNQDEQRRQSSATDQLPLHTATSSDGTRHQRGLFKNKCWWLLNLLHIPNKGSGRKDEHRWLVDLLNIQNKAGTTPGDLIADKISLPHRIQKTIKDSHEMVGVRSVWKIPKKETNNYVNTMGIIAALMATITFTAAFTVPGGLFDNIGTPIMVRKAAFQVFMISDVIAMCLSIVVLFLLLKIMATGDKRNTVVVMDLCIGLTLISFCATLVTFMTGLFTVMFSVKPSIAIVTLALCSLITAFILTFLFHKMLNPLKQIFLYFCWMSGEKQKQKQKLKQKQKQEQEQKTKLRKEATNPVAASQ